MDLCPCRVETAGSNTMLYVQANLSTYTAPSSARRSWAWSAPIRPRLMVDFGRAWISWTRLGLNALVHSIMKRFAAGTTVLVPWCPHPGAKCSRSSG